MCVHFIHTGVCVCVCQAGHLSRRGQQPLLHQDSQETEVLDEAEMQTNNLKPAEPEPEPQVKHTHTHMFMLYK